jgi:two-component system, response regulator
MENRAFKILVAEDDEDDQIILKAVLERMECLGQCGFLNSGKELLAYLAHEGKYAGAGKLPNLIVLDLNISKEWHDTLKALKSKATFVNIPVIVLTTPGKNDEQQCLKLGADAFVTKRIEFDDYFEAVRRALEPFCKEEIKLPDRS